MAFVFYYNHSHGGKEETLTQKLIPVKQRQMVKE
jgi:hypothetical protein